MLSTPAIQSQKIFWILFIAVLVIYGMFMTIDIMQVDAAQYATMSMQMMESGEYLELTCRDNDKYLDKPPLLFWLSSLSFELFGMGNVQFKFPSVLASLLAIFSVFKIARLFYNKQTAYFAAIILATSEAFFFTTNDVRTDNLLIGFSTFAIWQILLFVDKPNYKNAALAGVGIGMAMLGKGPMGLVFPMLAIGPHVLYARQLKVLLNLKWLIALPVIAIVLLPMCIGLYTQHRTHGLYFFFWEQSFGRITGENVWKNNMDPFFMVHTFFWAILPWTFFFIIAFFNQAKGLVVNKFKQTKSHPEIIGFSGYLLSTLALSQSEYQLPHYIFVAAPAGALMVAGFVYRTADKKINWIQVVAHVLNFLLVAFAFFIATLWSPDFTDYVIISIAVVVYVLAYIQLRKNHIVWLIALTGIVANFVLSFWFFKPVMAYQSTCDVGRLIKEMGVADQTTTYKAWGYGMDFYSNSIVTYPVNEFQLDVSIQDLDTFYLYTPAKELEDLRKCFHLEVIQEYDHFGVNRLKPKFLNPNTRAEAIEKRVFARGYRK